MHFCNILRVTVIHMIHLNTQLSTTLSPQLYQYLKMLQMNTAELDAHILELFESNPMLELDKESNTPSMEFQIGEIDFGRSKNVRNQEQDSPDVLNFIGNTSSNESIYSSMRTQIDLLGLPLPKRKLLYFLVADVDEDGYLSPDILEEMMEKFQISSEAAEDALRTLQTLDPCGVGARTLSESLVIQLQRLYPNEALAIEIACSHLEDIGKARFRKIAKSLNASIDDIERATEIIRSLNPRPGAVFESFENTPYIRPDVILQNEGNSFTISLQGNRANRISISSQYKDMLAESGDAEVKQYLKEKYTEAQNLMNQLEMRHSTLLSCTTKILERQQAFFLGMENAPRPYTQALLAEELKLNPSTVSRALSGKYLQCPEGIFPMAYFFPAEVTSESSASSADVSAMISKLIKEENKAAPLSDNDIQAALERNGLYISRRSIANYRNRLNIPPAALRKNNR